MSIDNISRLETLFGELSEDEQSQLFQRLSRQMGSERTGRSDLDEKELALMAADPDIQREIAEINAEFAVADADGLEDS